MDIQQNNVPVEAGAQQKKEGKNVLMAILAYIGPLVIVSYVVAKEDPFVKFHIKQGLVLLVIEAGVWILGMMLWQFWSVLSIINFATFVLSVVGIINAMKGKEEELPIVGKFSKYFPL